MKIILNKKKQYNKFTASFFASKKKKKKIQIFKSNFNFSAEKSFSIKK